MSGFLDPKRYGGVDVGVFASRPAPDAVPEEFVYVAVDTTSIYAVQSGAWVKVADLTAGVDWSELTNKPDEFPPEDHDLDTAHTGSLSITRVLGHDQWAPAHYRMALMAQVLGKM